MKRQLATLRKIDELSEQLQGEGKLLESLQCMEKSLILRGHCFGLDSIEVHHACKSVGEMCNFLAMACMQQNKTPLALEMLKKAEVLTERHPIVRAVTFNNLACYYRKLGKQRTALSYVEKAIKIESRYPITAKGVKAADTHLNACTIYSELHRHERAYAHARTALKLLLLELFGGGNSGGAASAGGAEGEGEEHGGEEGGEEGEGSAAAGGGGNGGIPGDRVAVLAIAYHNAAVQLEYLRRYEDALGAYEKAVTVVSTHLGEGHDLFAKMGKSLEDARKKLGQKVRQYYALNSTKRKQVVRGPQAAPTTLTASELAALQQSMGIAVTEEDIAAVEAEMAGDDDGHGDEHDDEHVHGAPRLAYDGAGDDAGGNDGDHGDAEHQEASEPPGHSAENEEDEVPEPAAAAAPAPISPVAQPAPAAKPVESARSASPPFARVGSASPPPMTPAEALLSRRSSGAASPALNARASLRAVASQLALRASGSSSNLVSQPLNEVAAEPAPAEASPTQAAAAGSGADTGADVAAAASARASARDSVRGSAQPSPRAAATPAEVPSAAMIDSADTTVAAGAANTDAAAVSVEPDPEAAARVAAAAAEDAAAEAAIIAAETEAGRSEVAAVAEDNGRRSEVAPAPYAPPADDEED
jgi:tetratricopeptide (TPR) repeat protein